MILELFKPRIARTKFNTVVGSSLSFQRGEQTFCFGPDGHGAERDPLLCLSFNPGLRIFFMSDIGSWIFVILAAFNEASVTLLLLFQIVAMVTRNMPYRWAITIADFSTFILRNQFSFYFQVNHLMWPCTGNISNGFCTFRGCEKQTNKQSMRLN